MQSGCLLQDDFSELNKPLLPLPVVFHQANSPIFWETISCVCTGKKIVQGLAVISALSSKKQNISLTDTTRLRIFHRMKTRIFQNKSFHCWSHTVKINKYQKFYLRKHTRWLKNSIRSDFPVENWLIRSMKICEL
jgi:hypothetical protein